jgi:hypothetical protein
MLIGIVAALRDAFSSEWKCAKAIAFLELLGPASCMWTI